MLTVHPKTWWRNKKNGNLYQVRYVATAAWDVQQTLIVYADCAYKIWVRSLSEFIEKFTAE